MFIAYFLLFVIFNGKLTLEVALFGLAFAGLLTLFCCRFLGYSLKKDLRLMRGLGSAISYGAMLVLEIVRANLTVMRMILTPGFEPEPQLVTFTSSLEDEGHRVALADSITLTPGTITCDLSENRFTVHCLDREQMEGIEETPFESALRQMEEKTAQREAQEAEKQEAESQETPVNESMDADVPASEEDAELEDADPEKTEREMEAGMPVEDCPDAAEEQGTSAEPMESGEEG